jgi:glycosyltransferase involved in cell wall biosynthesis
MNILLLTDDMLIGGVSRHVTDVANALSVSGNSMTVAATDGEARNWLHRDIEFIPIYLKNNDRLTNNYLGFITSYRKLHALFKQKKFDLVHSHKRYSHLLGKIVTKQFTIPYITSYHTTFRDKKYFSLFGDRTICCSNAVKESLLKYFVRSNEELVTIHNGVHSFQEYSQTEKENVRRRLNIQVFQTVIGSVGQFVREKDRETLLYALNNLKSKMDVSNIAVVLLGYGPQKNKIEQLCRTLNLEHIVRFVDSNFSVEALCNISSFMILNSITEGFPLVLLEAASIGKMHIATNISGIPEFIEDHVTGILVPPKNPNVLCDAIYSLLKDSAIAVQLGENAKQNYLRSFTFKKMLDSIHDVYRSLVVN